MLMAAQNLWEKSMFGELIRAIPMTFMILNNDNQFNNLNLCKELNESTNHTKSRIEGMEI